MPLINFDEASAIIAARWNDPTKPLHGLFFPSDPSAEQVLTYTPAVGEPRTYPARAMLFPYGEVLRKLTAARVGSNPALPLPLHRATATTKQRFEMLLRSLQRLDKSNSAYGAALDFGDIVISEGRDLMLDAVSVLGCLRTLADWLAAVMPFLVSPPPSGSTQPTLKNVIVGSINSASPYFQFFDGCNLDWFDKVAGGPNSRWGRGIRNYAEHWGTISLPTGLTTFAEGIQTPHTVRMLLGLPDGMQVSDDVVKDVHEISLGLLKFLDWLTRKVEGSHPNIDFKSAPITNFAVIPIVLDLGSLERTLPLIP